MAVAWPGKNVPVLPVLLGGLGQLQRVGGSGFSSRLSGAAAYSTTTAINCGSHFCAQLFTCYHQQSASSEFSTCRNATDGMRKSTGCKKAADLVSAFSGFHLSFIILSIRRAENSRNPEALGGGRGGRCRNAGAGQGKPAVAASRHLTESFLTC